MKEDVISAPLSLSFTSLSVSNLQAVNIDVNQKAPENLEQLDSCVSQVCCTGSAVTGARAYTENGGDFSHFLLKKGI